MQQDVLLQDDFAPFGQKGFPSATKVKFLAHHQRSASGGASGPDSATDEAPPNESQLDRKRRLNRNNERKKRAKKVVKIEELTSQFHDLSSQNENLKTESKALQERIALVKQYMKEHAEKKPAAHNGCAATSAVSGASRGGSLEEIFWTAASAFASRNQQGDNTTAGIPQVPSPHPTSTITSSPSSMQATSIASVASSVQTAASSTLHAAASALHTAASTQADLTFLPREQRVRLLQHELEKQDRILSMIRLQNGTLRAPLQVNDRPRIGGPHGHSAALLSQVLGAPTRTVSVATAPPQSNPLLSMPPANDGGVFNNNTNVSRQAAHQQTTDGALSNVERFLLQSQLLAALRNMQGDNRNGSSS